MQNICFVCTGNTCRSPFAEKIFNKYLKQAKLTEFKVFSCGIDADVTQDINPYVVQILKQHKINVKSRKPKKLTKAMLSKCDLFITMTKSQKQYIKANNVFSFGEMIGGEDILDPYGQDYQTYLNMSKQVDDYCKILIQKIINIKGNKQ